MRLTLGTLALLTLAGPAAAQDRWVSWGKIGVEFDQYRKDASDCGHVAWFKDVSNTEAATVFKRASRELEGSEYSPDLIRASPRPEDITEFAVDQARRSAGIVQTARPDKRIEEVRTHQYDVLGKCLTEKGYVRFRLTRQQLERLRTMRRGTDARHRYLHSLGSSRWIVETQKI